jgi:hypothetical protein
MPKLKKVSIKNKKVVAPVRVSIEEPIAPEKKVGEYKVQVKINGVNTEVFTDDIETSIMEAKPLFIKTNMLIIVTKGNLVRDRILNVSAVKRFFNNKMIRVAFIKTFLS